MTDNLSRSVTSNQSCIHENLPDVVKRNQQNTFLKPPAEHTLRSFESLNTQVAKHAAGIMLDSGCGTGISTRHIARQYPDSLVIGIDRSEIRLGKQYEDVLPDNALTVRADLVDFWKLAAEAGWTLQRHFILYPNPYPKSVHLKRRWHGHPIFPTLLKLGGVLELRTNWSVYADEFAEALRLSGYPEAHSEGFVPKTDKYLTLFEKKYHEAGQTLYRCCHPIPTPCSRVE